MSEPRFRRAHGVDLRSLPLTPEDAFLLSRIGETSTLSELAALTGGAPAQLSERLRRLAREGVVEVEPGEPPTRSPARAGEGGAALGSLDPLASFADDAASSAQPRAPLPAPALESLDPLATLGVTPEPETAAPSGASEWQLPPGVTPLEEEGAAEGAAEVGGAEGAARAPGGRPEPDVAEDPGGGGEPGADAALRDESLEPPELVAHDEQNYRRLYAALAHDLDVGGRAQRARIAEDPELTALCLDPDPHVVATLVENHRFGLAHARLLARWHRNGRGLELLARRSDLMRDAQVQRGLLVNPQLPESLLRRLFGSRRLLDLYRLAVDRELPERTRALSRGELRTRFAGVSEPEERADLVFKTEGRALLFLTGCTFDGRTTQLLCGRTFSSTLLVQNLARFSATPPVLLVKLLQQAVVKHSQQLRTLLLRHPNMPAEGKRRG